MKTFKEFLNEQTDVDPQQAKRLANFIDRKAEKAIENLPKDVEAEFYKGFPPKNPNKIKDYILSAVADSIGVSLSDVKQFVNLLVGRTDFDQVYNDKSFKKIVNTKNYDKKIRKLLKDIKIDLKTFNSIYGK